MKRNQIKCIDREKTNITLSCEIDSIKAQLVDFQSIILNQIFKINTFEKELSKYKSNQPSKMQSDDNIIKVAKEINVNKASRVRQDTVERDNSTVTNERNILKAQDDKINVSIGVR